jgi:hypothetical protein
VWQSIAYYCWLLVESVTGVFGVRLYEEPRYDVIDRVGARVEIRHYAPRLAAEVDFTLAGDAGRREAFQLLFAYIAGANRASAIGQGTIAMTAPLEVSGRELVAMTVPVETSDSVGAARMRFFLPAKYSLDTAPKALNPRVRLVTVSGETIATLRFTGSGSDLAERKAELIAQLANAKWRPSREPYALFYDAPFTLSFLRRNEAAVAVVKTP